MIRFDAVSWHAGAFRLDAVSFTVPAGSYGVLMGRTGCGKTTLLEILCGLRRPAGGRVFIGERDVTDLPPGERGIGYVPQDGAMFPTMTVREQLGFALAIRKRPAAEIAARVKELSEALGISALLDRRPQHLSGGERQRVALGRALAAKPSVLLLDEPLSNLDANLREEMRFEIRRLHDEFRITTVYVTHDQAEAMATSDRIAVMNAGKIEQVDAPHLLYTKPRTRFVAGFVGRTNLLEARVEAGALLLGNLSLGPAAAAGIAPDVSGNILLSLRPQAMSLHVTEPARESAALIMPVTILERTYLGEAWDYVLRPEGAELRLRAAAPPLAAHEIGAKLWLRIDPQQIAVVQ